MLLRIRICMLERKVDISEECKFCKGWFCSHDDGTLEIAYGLYQIKEIRQSTLALFIIQDLPVNTVSIFTGDAQGSEN